MFGYLDACTRLSTSYAPRDLVRRVTCAYFVRRTHLTKTRLCDLCLSRLAGSAAVQGHHRFTHHALNCPVPKRADNKQGRGYNNEEADTTTVHTRYYQHMACSHVQENRQNPTGARLQHTQVNRNPEKPQKYAKTHGSPLAPQNAAYAPAADFSSSMYASIGGHVHTRFRSPNTSSTRLVVGQNLASRVHDAGKAAVSRE